MLAVNVFQKRAVSMLVYMFAINKCRSKTEKSKIVVLHTAARIARPYP